MFDKLSNPYDPRQFSTKSSQGNSFPQNKVPNGKEVEKIHKKEAAKDSSPENLNELFFPLEELVIMVEKEELDLKAKAVKQLSSVQRTLELQGAGEIIEAEWSGYADQIHFIHEQLSSQQNHKSESQALDFLGEAKNCIEEIQSSEKDIVVIEAVNKKGEQLGEWAVAEFDRELPLKVERISHLIAEASSALESALEKEGEEEPINEVEEVQKLALQLLSQNESDQLEKVVLKDKLIQAILNLDIDFEAA